jgi:hypothetical protein
VPLVVIDTNVSLPATLSSTGLTRKFWMLLAFGAASYRAEHLHLELDALDTSSWSAATLTASTARRMRVGAAILRSRPRVYAV